MFIDNNRDLLQERLFIFGYGVLWEKDFNMVIVVLILESTD